MDNFWDILEGHQEDQLLPTLADHWFDGFIALDDDDRGEYSAYQHDPIGFCEDILQIELTNDQKRLLVAIRDYDNVIVMSATAVGKTFILSAAAIWLYKCNKDIELYMGAAPPERNLKRLLWGELTRFIHDKPEVFKGDSITNLLVKRAPKQQIEGITIPSSANEEETEARFSGKHQDCIVFFFDEADAIPDPVFKGAEGCTGTTMTKMVLCYNPRRREGEPYRMIKEGRAHVISMSAFDHPNVRSGRNIIKGAVTRFITVRRINEWCEKWPDDEPPTPDCFALPDFLVGEIATSAAGEEFPPLQPGWYRIVKKEFFYKVLGQYPTAGSSQLFSDEDIDRARSNYDLYVARNGTEPPGGVAPIMSLDIADLGDDSNACFFRYGGYVAPPHIWNGVDPDMTATRAIKLYHRHGAIAAHIDSIGVGAGVPGKMARAGCVGAIGIKVNNKRNTKTEDGWFKTVRDEAYWMFSKWLKSPSAMLPPGRYIDDMRMVTYDHIGDYIVVMDKKSMKKIMGHSPDELEALMLSFTVGKTWMGGI